MRVSKNFLILKSDFICGIWKAVSANYLIFLSKNQTNIRENYKELSQSRFFALLYVEINIMACIVFTLSRLIRNKKLNTRHINKIAHLM